MKKIEKEPLFWMHRHKETNRYWFHYGHNNLGIQIARPSFHMSFGIGGYDHALHGDFCGFYWHIDSSALAKRLPRCDNSFRFYWHEWGLWLTFWGNDYESCRNDPWWRRMYHLNFTDLLLGRAKYSNQKIKEFENIVIPMPEGNFKATMTFGIRTWKRPRWFSKVRKYTETDIQETAPKFPGKGENSWDCGDDAIWGCSIEGHSLPKAIGDYVYRVLEYRERRGVRSALIYKEGR